MDNHQRVYTTLTVRRNTHKPETIMSLEGSSTIDSVGVVFSINGEVYRAITSQAASHVRELLSHKNINKMFDAGLIPTEIVNDIQVDNYALIVKHHLIQFKSMPWEWPPNMLRDSALMVIRLHRELWKHGYMLKDGQAMNTFFDYTTPYQVDFGSVIKQRGTFPMDWSGVFGAHYIKWLSNYSDVATNEYFKIRDSNKNNVMKFFDIIENWLSSITFTYPTTAWTHYGGHKIDMTNYKQTSTINTLKELIKENDVCSMIDIAANKGRYANVAADLGYDVVAFDIDIPSISALYEQTKNTKKHILPLVMDIMKPTKRHRGHIPAQDRLKCDVSLSLALLNHLCLRKGVPLDKVVHNICSFTNKYAVIEFISTFDKHVQNWSKPDWYTSDKLVGHMKANKFKFIKLLPSSPEPRIIMVFKRIK